MTFDYVEARETADELIEEFGQSVSLRKTSLAGVAAWKPTATIADTTTKAAIIEYDSRLVDGTTILRTDRRALVSAGPLASAGVVPKPGDALVIDGTAIPIAPDGVQTIAPAGVPVIYDCQLRA